MSAQENPATRAGSLWALRPNSAGAAEMQRYRLDRGRVGRRWWVRAPAALARIGCVRCTPYLHTTPPTQSNAGDQADDSTAHCSSYCLSYARHPPTMRRHDRPRLAVDQCRDAGLQDVVGNSPSGSARLNQSCSIQANRLGASWGPSSSIAIMAPSSQSSNAASEATTRSRSAFMLASCHRSKPATSPLGVDWIYIPTVLLRDSPR